MNNYLLKWTCNDKVAYKTGISKDHTQLLENRFGKSSKFYHPGYSLFKIEELAHVYCSSESYSLARAAAFGMEHAFKAVFPKNFQLEDHFNLKPGVLDGMGGITEFFLLPSYISEEEMISIFERAHKNVWQLNNKLKSYQGTVSAEMNI
tara:strand:- start:29 stop:475 length:447 start_codon:yes stop_codon:yes gene_type:complete